MQIYKNVGHVFQGENGVMRCDVIFKAELRTLAFLRRHLNKPATTSARK